MILLKWGLEPNTIWPVCVVVTDWSKYILHTHLKKNYIFCCNSEKTRYPNILNNITTLGMVVWIKKSCEDGVFHISKLDLQSIIQTTLPINCAPRRAWTSGPGVISTVLYLLSYRSFKNSHVKHIVPQINRCFKITLSGFVN